MEQGLIKQQSLFVVKPYALLQDPPSEETVTQQVLVPFAPFCQTKSFMSPQSLAASPLLSVTLTPFTAFSSCSCQCDPCQQISGGEEKTPLFNNRTNTLGHTCSHTLSSLERLLPRSVYQDSHILCQLLSTVQCQVPVCFTL